MHGLTQFTFHVKCVCVWIKQDKVDEVGLIEKPNPGIIWQNL